ncbi:hypothetical protein [Ensifer sp. M14]|uniref:hypothetical protein n=1 Tax=Ensifer sp. M14 TaxID=2203782 RepID=UPI001314FBCD|nr:hypothetical protein [Ensifer sp. M14]
MLFSRDKRFGWQTAPSVESGGIEVREGTSHQRAGKGPAIGRAQARLEIEALGEV